MTSALQPFDRASRRRPFWLLLVLALFLAGQVASAAHWHEASAALQVDADCALCVLSGANGAAAVAGGWQLPVLPCAILVVFLFVALVRRTFVRLQDSRAPPSVLNFSA